VAVPAGNGNTAIQCPACGQATRPQAFHFSWRWLLVFAGVVLFVGTGLTFLIHALQPPEPTSSPDNTQAVAESQTKLIDQTKSPTATLPKTRVVVTARKRKPANPANEKPPENKPPPEPDDESPLPKQVKLRPVPPPEVQVERVEPAEPEADGKLTVYLTANKAGAGGLRYQYRLSPDADWKLAPEGRVRLTKLKLGLLKLEVRVVDKDGRPSAVRTRTWTVKAAPEPKPRPAVLATLKQGDTFFQEVVITRLSSYRFLGTEIKQNTQYGFLSTLKVEKKRDDGSMVVSQKVETARFTDGDPAMQTLLNGALQKTKGANFKIKLNAKREVTKFEGAGDGINVFEGKKELAGQTFMLWSFLDRDGWKELAQVTLFRPEKPSGTAAKWARPITHSWGPLGSWSGKIVYGYTGKKGKIDRIGYVLDMAYRPPARGAGAGLPFQVGKAVFKPQTAAGAILFDTSRDQVAAAEERFHVKGALAINALGVDTVIDMDEVQIFRLRVLDKKPAANKK
jgi:hypothetical protein